MYSDEKDSIHDRKLFQYLLGMLTPEETEQLDELSIADDEFAARLQAVECDLVDEYVRGLLPDDMREQFKSHYLASPKRREKVGFAEAFLRSPAVSVETTAVLTRAEAGPASKPSKSRLFALPSPAWQWGFAAASLLMLLTIGYLVFDNSRLRARVNSAQAEREVLQHREQELQKQLGEQQSADAELQQELDRVRESLAALEQRNQDISEPRRDSAIVSLVLLPPTRGAGQAVTASLKRETDFLNLNLHLEPDDFTDYRATLKDPNANREVWRSGKLKPRSRGTARLISINVPASRLRQQHYIVELTGFRADGSSQLISGYPFRVVVVE